MTSVRECIRACDAAGLDITHLFSVGWYNRAVGSGDALPDFGRRAALGLLIGNTRAFWEPLRAAVRADAALRDDLNPLDTFVTRAVREAVAMIDARTLVLWAHVSEPAALPIQRIAEAVGLASLSPSHLSIHPTYGPWFALRALVIVDVDGPHGEPPRLRNPCESCHRPCLPALEEAVRAGNGPGLAVATRTEWRRWVRVREVCPEGTEYHYGERQIEYHYAKKREDLTKE